MICTGLCNIKRRMRASMIPFAIALFLLITSIAPVSCNSNGDGPPDDSTSSFSRAMAAQAAHPTNPSNVVAKRQRFPEDKPQICLAFLSCCGRTDLLNHTMAAAIRHMEHDEPAGLRYEIAWVDNGSGKEKTSFIEDSFQIEHSLPMPQNAGLAFGDNLLIFNLCTAPYILLMEEDWLYLDDLVATQTEKRKRAIATAIALTRSNLTAYDGRQVMGVFLRPETYGGFLKWPNMDLWETTEVDLAPVLVNQQEPNMISVDYQIFCADTSFHSGYVWGSYTNGVGLYSREALIDIGRMYGEPSDAFHNRFVEGNYAYRAGLKYCHAAIHLDDDPNCREVAKPACAAAFYHIGGGRGTQPNTIKGAKCIDDSWYFYGTPMYKRYLKMKEFSGQGAQVCTAEDLAEMTAAEAKTKDSEEYRKQVEQQNKEAFEKERQQRDEMRRQAQLIRATDPALLRQSLPMFATMSNEEIWEFADKTERRADSPHPLQGFWDSHGRTMQ